ncbi:MAG: nicotinate (nicotinamide) nucleotide adenylyltransferase [Desulfobulbus sp.]|uniref:nicotinate (nicotinamide) nucleotide adenylyltransferase n=1 Tax=Desulfobulbus sp. TaxID=895 RepID=UPI00283EF6FF|nr:nicotinate (nicotinamide) nucleotide adenylyltransferase [Desulfobulbus sp.]MDR2550911.1 nicotinate (nicotinamide) nucleotide adenylyltransferase [Desulfobulbus sp.]
MVAADEALRIGLFGGTFDPVHQGHIELALHVLARCRLDRLLFIPALLPPHKQQPVASFAHRAGMIEAALADCRQTDGRVRCSRIEERLPAPSYTLNTVRALISEEAGCRYSLVIGADSLLDLPHWHRIDELLQTVDLIVVKRDEIDRAAVDRALAALTPAFVPNPGHCDRWHGQGGRIALYLDDIELPVSSSAIREELAKGMAPALLPPSVLAHVRRHRLYGWKEAV